MTWTVSYSYGNTRDAQTFDDEEEAIDFYETIEELIHEFGNDPDNQYESKVEVKENTD